MHRETNEDETQVQRKKGRKEVEESGRKEGETTRRAAT